MTDTVFFQIKFEWSKVCVSSLRKCKLYSDQKITLVFFLLNVHIKAAYYHCISLVPLPLTAPTTFCSVLHAVPNHTRSEATGFTRFWDASKMCRGVAGVIYTYLCV